MGEISDNWQVDQQDRQPAGPDRIDTNEPVSQRILRVDAC